MVQSMENTLKCLNFNIRVPASPMLKNTTVIAVDDF